MDKFGSLVEIDCRDGKYQRREELRPACMAAALLTSETVILHNIPYVRDIITQRRLLEDVGATV